MSGLYLHIPFCRKACHYCSFYFSTSLRHRDELLGALVAEIRHREHFLEDTPLSTIYFGGGTPSILSLQEIERLLSSISNVFEIKKDVEITLEANPEDLDKEKLEGLKALGVNRLSIGIQSFHNTDLDFMNRSHDSAKAKEVIELVMKTGFRSFSVDLMFGLVEGNMSLWSQNIETILSYEVPHLSCYNLTLEEQTAFHHWYKKGKITLPPDVDQNEQFYHASKVLTNVGYEHYEVSNYALPGHESLHNWQYWQRSPYLGIGPSAHSFDGNTRYWNESSNIRYIRRIQSGDFHMESERLSDSDHLNEIVMLGLRTRRGINKDDLLSLPDALRNSWFKGLEGYLAKDIIREDPNAYVLNRVHWHMADFISADLFYDT